MGEIININRSENVGVTRKENDLIEFAEGILLDTRADLVTKNTLSVPIASQVLNVGVNSFTTMCTVMLLVFLIPPRRY
ncbi:MAG: hypothetical protein AB7Y74_14235 [Syntrophorhabdus sp.]